MQRSSGNSRARERRVRPFAYAWRAVFALGPAPALARAMAATRSRIRFGATNSPVCSRVRNLIENVGQARAARIDDDPVIRKAPVEDPRPPEPSVAIRASGAFRTSPRRA
jgi:hypothetical protein